MKKIFFLILICLFMTVNSYASKTEKIKKKDGGTLEVETTEITSVFFTISDLRNTENSLMKAISNTQETINALNIQRQNIQSKIDQAILLGIEEIEE